MNNFVEREVKTRKPLLAGGFDTFVLNHRVLLNRRNHDKPNSNLD